MIPRLLLSLWRERWGKPPASASTVPYVYGKLNQGIDWIPHAAAWSVPGVAPLAILVGICCLFLVVGLQLKFDRQFEFGLFFVAIAIFLRRYRGTLITLILFMMSAVASLRYIYWRFEASLAPDFSLSFALRMLFFGVELYLTITAALGLLILIFPIRHKSQKLPDDTLSWPTIDIFLICNDKNIQDIKNSLIDGSEINWPRRRIEYYLIDDQQRQEIKQLAESFKATYIESKNDSSNNLLLNFSPASTGKGEFAVIIKVGDKPSKELFKETIGWFNQDASLGMLLTPKHFLAPEPPTEINEIFSLSNQTNSCVIFRRTVLDNLDEVDFLSTSLHKHVALRLQSFGYRCSYFGAQSLADTDNQGQGLVLNYFRVEHPFSAKSLGWRRLLITSHRVFSFYRPASQLFFALVPLAYLLGRVQLIDTTLGIWLAYVTPHLLHFFITSSRFRDSKRFTIIFDAREFILAWYMLLPTFFSFLKTSAAQLGKIKYVSVLKNKNKQLIAKRRDRRFWTNRVKITMCIVVFLLSLISLIDGLIKIMIYQIPSTSFYIFCILWTTYNVISLVAMVALMQEAKKIHSQIQNCARLQANLRLPSGQTIQCETQNFPNTFLKLSFAVPISINPGVSAIVYLFMNHNELSCNAIVMQNFDNTVVVKICSESQLDYESLAAKIFVRGADWPKWLPGYKADKPLPEWLSRRLMSAVIYLLDLATNSGKYFQWAKLSSFVNLWRK